MYDHVQACLPVNYSVALDPPAGGWVVTEKNLQCLHTLLNTAICLGGVLSTSAWMLIMPTVQVWRHTCVLPTLCALVLFDFIELRRKPKLKSSVL